MEIKHSVTAPTLEASRIPVLPFKQPTHGKSHTPLVVDLLWIFDFSGSGYFTAYVRGVQLAARGPHPARDPF